MGTIKQFDIIIGNCDQINQIFYFDHQWNNKTGIPITMITWKQIRDN